MVSLIRNVNSPSGSNGDTVNIINADDDEFEVLNSSIIGEIAEFKPIKTVFSTLFSIFITVFICILSILVGFIWPKDREKCEPFYILLYTQALFWLIILTHYFYLRCQHKRLRISGYLDFYVKMKYIYTAPLHIVSLWCVIILILFGALQQLNHQSVIDCYIPQSNNDIFTPVLALGIIIFIETIIINVFLIIYLVKIYKFNKNCPIPDTQREEWLTRLFCHEFSHSRRNPATMRKTKILTKDVLERQADYIRYLRDNIAQLSEKILHLSSSLTGDPDV